MRGRRQGFQEFRESYQPRGGPRSLTITISQTLYDAVSNCARQRNVSRQQVIGELVERAFGGAPAEADKKIAGQRQR